MRQRFGAGVRQEVLGEVMSRSFQEAVIQEKLRPAPAQHRAEKSGGGQGPRVRCHFEVFPEVEIVEMKGLGS